MNHLFVVFKKKTVFHRNLNRDELRKITALIISQYFIIIIIRSKADTKKKKKEKKGITVSANFNVKNFKGTDINI